MTWITLWGPDQPLDLLRVRKFLVSLRKTVATPPFQFTSFPALLSLKRELVDEYNFRDDDYQYPFKVYHYAPIDQIIPREHLQASCTCLGPFLLNPSSTMAVEIQIILAFVFRFRKAPVKALYSCLKRQQN